MLFTYPVAATADNWLHNCLVEAVVAIHDCACRGASVPEWPDIVPAEHRDKLRARGGLKDKLDAYRAVIVGLTAAERDRVADALMQQNRIADLVSRTCECDRIDDLPATIRESVRELFAFAFRLLTDLSIRDGQYRAIYQAIESKLCPFCACEYFDAPTGPREDLDHYLARSVYPFAGANLRNLVPMGAKCNSRYKLNSDILHGPGGRRRAFDPYGVRTARISLQRSVPFDGLAGELPRWEIDIDPDSEEARTWDDVFALKERYRRDILDVNFKTWLAWFGAWCKSAELQLADLSSLIVALDRYIGMLVARKFEERAFLQVAVFQMLRAKCSVDVRLTSLLIGIAGQYSA